eukprot:8841324-Pyramimonas_sp.AAC.3
MQVRELKAAHERELDRELTAASEKFLVSERHVATLEREVREVKAMHEIYKARAESFDYKESATVAQLKEASASAMREAER